LFPLHGAQSVPIVKLTPTRSQHLYNQRQAATLLVFPESNGTVMPDSIPILYRPHNARATPVYFQRKSPPGGIHNDLLRRGETMRSRRAYFYNFSCCEYHYFLLLLYIAADVNP